MSVYKPEGARFYYYRFQRRGREFHGPTHCTTRRAAEEVERRARAEAAAAANRPTDTLDAIAGRWWQERGQHRRDAKDVEYRLERILLALGPDRRAVDLSQADIAAYVARRRAQPIAGNARKGRAAARLTSPATINRELEVMRAAWRHAMKAGTPLASVDWSVERLDEPAPRERVISPEEEDRIFAQIRPGYAEFFAAMIVAGWRWDTAATLRWRDLRPSRIEREGKGGRIVRTPLTRALRALIEGEMGNHPEFVWTVPARATRDGRVRGRRYPLTYGAARAEWQRACCAAGLEPVNIHQLRHTAATRLLRATGNLAMVQKLLGHSRITTTTRYAHVLEEDLLAGMESVAKSRTKFRTAKRRKA